MGGFSTVTPQGASQTAVAMTVWSYSPRSLTDIQNLVNAIQNNNPNMLSTLSDIVYIPLPYYAGQVSITQVASFINNLVQNYGLVGQVALGISASPYNLWSTSFITQLMPYLSQTSLNQIIISSQMDENHVQGILYYLVQNYYYNKWIQTITANYGSSTISTNVTITTSVIFAQNLTISSGVTVTCGLKTCYFVTQQFNNYGTIVNNNGGIGGTGGGGGGYGGIGGGGIVVLALTSALGTINVDGSNGSNGVQVGSSSHGLPGGTGAISSLSATAPIGGGGYYDGGGGAPNTGNTCCGAQSGSVTLTLFNNGNSMLTYIMQGVSDWWTINALGKLPYLPTPLYNIYNAGGGGGGDDGAYSGGGGGGGGGEVIAYAYNFINGSISANGGNRGVASGNNYNGGGGAGGLIYIFYGSTSDSLTFSVAGGSGANIGSTGIATTIQVTVNG